MKTFKYSALVLAVAAFLNAGAAFAQTASMPVLYNQSGTPVNMGATPLLAGYYYIGGGQAAGGHQVYYYGNGTYYDQLTDTYGGSVSDPNGTAGLSLDYTAPVVTAPNTGAGGDAALNWTLLGISSLALIGSLAYIGRKAIAA